MTSRLQPQPAPQEDRRAVVFEQVSLMAEIVHAEEKRDALADVFGIDLESPCPGQMELAKQQGGCEGDPRLP
jgi:hypothetical protein